MTQSADDNGRFDEFQFSPIRSFTEANVNQIGLSKEASLNEGDTDAPGDLSPWRSPAQILARTGIQQGVKEIPCGIDKIDACLRGGVRPGSITTVVARTGGCKSQLASNMARRSASKGEPVLLLSLEDPEEETVLRLLSQTSLIPFNKLRRGIAHLTDTNQQSAVLRAMYELSNLPIRISCHRRLDDLCSVLQLHHEQNGSLVIIDYMNCVDIATDGIGSKDAFEFQRATMVIRELEIMAKELGLAIILFCQANRSGLMSAEPLELHHIRDSGFIEHISTAVLSIERPLCHDTSTADRIGPKFTLPMRVLKNRWGPTHKAVGEGSSGHEIKKGVAERIKRLEYDCIRLAWYPAIHRIESHWLQLESDSASTRSWGYSAREP